MKSKVSVLILAALLLAIALMLTACGDLGGWLPDPNAPPVDGEAPGDTDGDEPEAPATVKLTLKNKSRDHKIDALTLETGAVLTEEVAASLYTLIDSKGGYRFVSWEYEDGRPFDPSLPITENITIYGVRDDLAGIGITYSISEDWTRLTFEGSGDMYDFFYQDDAPWNKYARLVTEISFEGEITSIGAMSFYGFDRLTKVVLPDTVTRIGKNAFYESSVNEINFPPALTEIGSSAFNKCKNLVTLNFNSALVTIGAGAFQDCTGVKRVKLTDALSLIDGNAFNRCDGIESVYYVGNSEQYDEIRTRLNNFWVQDLANVYFLSESKPEERGPYWHYNSDGEITQWYYTVSYYATRALVPFTYDYVDPENGVDAENMAFMSEIVYNGYRFAGWKKENSNRSIYLGEKLNGDIKLIGQRGNVCGDNMTWEHSYYGSSVKTTLVIKGSGRMWDFKTIKDSPWYGLNITRIVIESGVEHIGSYAFCNLTDIVSIDIPKNVTSIHKDAFSGCNKLRYIYYMADASFAAEVDNLFMLGGLIDTVVYTFSESGLTDEGAFWRYVTDDGVEKRVAWEYSDGKLTVGGDESLPNYSSAELTPWYQHRNEATYVAIRNGANRVGAYTFDGFTLVTDASIADSVRKIAATAFTNTGVYNNPDSWEGGALYISSHLIKVKASEVGEIFLIKTGTVSLADNCFEGCASIKYLLIDKNIKGVYSNVFRALTALEEIYFTGTTFSSWDAFVSNSDISTAVGFIPDGVTVYCYSKFAPVAEGNFWHYDNNDIVKWD